MNTHDEANRRRWNELVRIHLRLSPRVVVLTAQRSATITSMPLLNESNP